MRRQLFASALLALFGAVRLSAQGNSQCAGFLLAQETNVCNAAVDGAHVFAPVVGILMSGGNPFLGATGGLGRFPHSGFTIRANVTKIVVPDAKYAGDGTTVGAQQKVLAPAPLIEGALGVFGGASGGHLAIDLLGSAQLLPTTLLDNVHVDVNANSIGTIAVGFGYGARVTLLPEGAALPAIAVSVMRRSLPRLGIGSISGGDEYAFAAQLTATNYRVTAGKRLGPLMVGGGAGWDTYTGDGDVVFRDPVTHVPQAPVALAVDDSRALVFADGGIAAGPVYLIGELGLMRGKDLHTVTTFSENDPKASRLFGSLGLRVGF